MKGLYRAPEKKVFALKIATDAKTFLSASRCTNALAFIVVQAHNSMILEATPARTHGQAAGGVALTLSDRFCTPTLIRPNNEREGWDMSFIP
jgi:hypothetical protein